MDPDIMIALSIPLIFKINHSIYQGRIRNLLSVDIYKVNRSSVAEKQLRTLANLFEEKVAPCELYTYLNEHVKKCSRTSCYCFLLKYRI